MDAETQDLLRGSIREMFAAGDGDIVTGLRELGWDDVVAEDPDAAIELLFTEQGAAGKASSALDTVAAATDSGGTTHPVVHPLGTDAAARITGDGVDIDGVLLSEPRAAAVVATADGDTYLINDAEIAGAATPVGGFAPASRLYRVKLSIDARSAVPVDVDWAQVTAAARRALAAELVGNGTAMLNLATAQIADRHQFGRPIGANQSPRHRLAESYAHLGGAAELVRMAWQSGSAWDARVAKAYAGQAIDTTSRACLQVCGAIGLTTEHLLPAYVQRARILDALYGGWAAVVSDLGAQLMAAVGVPPGYRL
jgi:Acyl-CoA dehydrogenase, C-terminal domain